MGYRVVEVETKHGLMAATAEGGASSIDTKHVAAQLFIPFLCAGQSSNLFLRSGEYFYLSIGTRPEYATAEYDRLGDLLEQDHAGPSILAELALEADEAFEEPGQPEGLHLLRNDPDSQGNPCGYYKNYLLHRRCGFRQVADALVSLFTIRQILVGNDEIHHSTSGTALSFSQHAEQMWNTVSPAMTRSRPITDTRDEPLADSGSYRRMHVIIGDTSVAESTSALKIGTIELLLQTVEDRLVIEDLALADLMWTIHEVSVDLSGSTRIELTNGRWATPIEIQKTIRERVLDSIDSGSMDRTHLYLVDLWGRDLGATSSGDRSTMETKPDIAIKHKLSSTYTAKIGATLADPRVARLELSCYDVTAQGLLPKLEGTGLVKHLTYPEGVRRAITAPPQTARARLRGAIIGAVEDVRANVSVGQVHTRLDDHVTSPFSPQDPPAGEDPFVDAFIEKIYDHAPVLLA